MRKEKSKGITMRASFTAALAAAALLGLASLPASAAVHRDGTLGSGFAWNETSRLEFVRGTIEYSPMPQRPRGFDRWEEPRRRGYDRWERPRRARAAHVRPGRRARTHLQRHARRRILRQPQRHVRRHALRPHRIVRRPARIPVRPYPVRALPVGSDAVGVASYYWQGHTTASGTRYNPNGLTAAHRTLPFGTRVRVTHLGNGRSVDVRINDRGPYISGRMIDLSRGAAGVIGMHRQGVARVKVTVLGR
jgi:rare lipoprotein A